MASSMACIRCSPSRLILVVLSFILPTVLATYTPFLPLSFLFSWGPPGQSLSIPVTEQCSWLNITWGRSSATGPSPVAPYYLQVYSSSYVFPFIFPAGSTLSFSWQVPFAPGTLYQICMFDSIGNTGGCQATYTVIAPSASTTPPTCTNVTIPSTPLNVNAQVLAGGLHQYDWVPQCTDIEVSPQNGKPPYIFTIAPSLHPPYNITSNSSSINWTVALTWAMPFFISVVDSAGNSWANGPLHSGDGPNVECLGVSSATPPKKPFPTATLASAIGSAVGGLILGFILTQLFQRSRFKSMNYSPHGPIPMSPSTEYHAIPTDAGSPQYRIEPFTMPGENANSLRDLHQRVTSVSGVTDVPLSPTSFSEPESQAGPSQSMPQVYVVHHDAGQMPVTVYTAGGSVVTELPPGYPGDSSRPAPGSTAGSSSQPSDDLAEMPFERRPQPGPTPRKG